MKMRNYTSSVPVERSVNAIERKLVEAGAFRISKVYEGRELAGVMFQISNIVFKLPSRVGQVEKALMADVRKPRPGTADRIREQAARTAWKILAEWAEIQVTLINLQQAEAVEVFLPYAWNMRTRPFSRPSRKGDSRSWNSTTGETVRSGERNHKPKEDGRNED